MYIYWNEFLTVPLWAHLSVSRHGGSDELCHTVLPVLSCVILCVPACSPEFRPLGQTPERKTSRVTRPCTWRPGQQTQAWPSSSEPTCQETDKRAQDRTLHKRPLFVPRRNISDRKPEVNPPNFDSSQKNVFSFASEPANESVMRCNWDGGMQELSWHAIQTQTLHACGGVCVCENCMQEKYADTRHGTPTWGLCGWTG